MPRNGKTIWRMVEHYEAKPSGVVLAHLSCGHIIVHKHRESRPESKHCPECTTMKALQANEKPPEAPLESCPFCGEIHEWKSNPDGTESIICDGWVLLTCYPWYDKRSATLFWNTRA